MDLIDHVFSHLRDRFISLQQYLHLFLPIFITLIILSLPIFRRHIPDLLVLDHILEIMKELGTIQGITPDIIRGTTLVGTFQLTLLLFLIHLFLHLITIHATQMIECIHFHSQNKMFAFNQLDCRPGATLQKCYRLNCL